MEDSAGDGLTKAIEAALHGRRNISNNKSQRLTIADEGRNFKPPTTKDTGNAGGAAAVASMHAGLEAAEALRHLSAERATLVKQLSSVDSRYAKQLGTCNDVARSGVAIASRVKRAGASSRLLFCTSPPVVQVFRIFVLPVIECGLDQPQYLLAGQRLLRLRYRYRFPTLALCLLCIGT